MKKRPKSEQILGMGEVTLKGEHIATVDYRLRYQRDVAEIHTGGRTFTISLVLPWIFTEP